MPHHRFYTEGQVSQELGENPFRHSKMLDLGYIWLDGAQSIRFM